MILKWQLLKNRLNKYIKILKILYLLIKHLISNIDELAQGKIYTGKQAKELKLIDDIGGYDKAFEIAKTYINEKDDQIEIIHYPAEIESFADLLKQSKMKETDNRYDFFKRFQSQSTSVYKNVFNTQQNSVMNQIYQFFFNQDSNPTWTDPTNDVFKMNVNNSIKLLFIPPSIK